MRRSTVVAGIIVQVLVANIAVAEDVTINLRLPNCPTQLTLLVPEAFRGAVAEEDLLAAYRPFLFAETRGVFAAAVPDDRDIVLLVVEPNRSSEVQGSVTPEQFNAVKEAMLARNPSSAVVEANEILQKKDTLINEYNGIVQSSTDTSAAVSLVLDGSTTGNTFTSLTGFKILYSQQCLVGTILIAPRPGIERRSFEEMMRDISTQ